jgi:cytoskeletal protein RodZ
MRFEASQKRNGLAARNLSLALVAITVGLAAITAAFFISQDSLPANPDAHSSSSSLGSSSSVSSSSSTTVRSTNHSASQYPVSSSTTSISISSLGQPSCECWIPRGAPNYSVAGNGWVTAVVTYYNGFNTTVTGTAYLVIRNSLGQMVGIDNTTTTIPAGQNATLHPTVVGLLPDGTSRLPPGSYSTSVYATTLNGSLISTVSIGSFNDEPLPVAFTGSDSAFGSGPVTFTLFFTNLYPSPLTGTLYGFANDTSGRTFFNATATVSISGDSNGNATLVFSTGNINYCYLDYSFVLRAPNGTALSPYDHEGGPECRPAGLPVSLPVDSQRILISTASLAYLIGGVARSITVPGNGFRSLKRFA